MADAMPKQPAVAATRSCAQCGATNPPAARFCRWCGMPAEEPVMQPVVRLTALVRQWRGLRPRLTRTDVRRLLGEPAHVGTADGESPGERWTYRYAPAAAESERGAAAAPSGYVDFAPPDSIVSAWQEPAWEAVRET